MYRSPLFYAVLAFIISLIVIGILMPALTCMDGWQSGSIGKSGACSHHGGVNYLPVTIGLLVSYGIAFFVWRFAKKHEKRLKDPENDIIVQAEQQSKSLLDTLNSLLCGFWNFCVKTLQKMGLGKLFDKAPIITVIGCFLIVALLPPLMISLFALGLVAGLNGASPETGYLVPNKE